jgi:hypothetical protein
LRLPDFVIGGAARSGTTWLYRLLERHPAIYMARPVKPEPKFFLIDELYAKGLAHYSRTWFAGVAETAVAGEKSTNYLESAAAAERLAADLPRVKLVFILREPVSRAWSNYAWSRMNGLETEDFATALSREAERERTLPERLRFARPFSYFSRGLYADMLRPYFDRFPRDRILILKFERIASEPGRLAADVHAFLDVEPRPGDADRLDVINPSDAPSIEIPEEARRELCARYGEPNRRLAALLGPEFSWDR